MAKEFFYKCKNGHPWSTLLPQDNICPYCREEGELIKTEGKSDIPTEKPDLPSDLED